MTIKIADITNLQVEGHSDHRAAIGFEAGDRRFHIWISYRDATGWQMDKVIHSNPLTGGSYKDHRELDINAASNAKLQAFLAEQVGDITVAAERAVAQMVATREQAAQDQRQQLAANIRASLDRNKADLPTPLYENLVDQEDEALINLRGVLYGVTYPENTFPIGVVPVETAKVAA